MTEKKNRISEKLKSIAEKHDKDISVAQIKKTLEDRYDV